MSLYSDKQVQSGKITLFKADEIIDDDKEVANIFNNFFANAVKNLNIKMNDDHMSDTENQTDNVNMRCFVRFDTICTI